VSFTVVPLHNLNLPAGTNVSFGRGFVFQDVPAWVRTDQQILATLSQGERMLIERTRHALVAEYYADSLGYADPEWKGERPKSIQDLRLEAAILANFAIWLVQPSPVCFTTVFHALTHMDHQVFEVPLTNSTPCERPLYCHPEDTGNPFEKRHLLRAAKIHRQLCMIPRKNAVWEALRAFWGALTMEPPDYRYSLFWMGLEALFSPENRRHHLTRNLCQRIALFLADGKKDAQSIYKKAFHCYDVRSTIVHGRWENDPSITAAMKDTEAIVRTSVRTLIARPEDLGAFLTRKRDSWLKAMHQKKAGWLSC
jgi:hypothetical protein